MIFFFSFLSIIGASICPIDELPIEQLTERVYLHEFQPKDRMAIRKNKKPQMRYGYPNRQLWGLISYLDSQPVEETLRYIQKFLGSSGRTIPESLGRNAFSEYQFVSRLIDVRLLRLLMRFASRKLHPDEIGITSATDIIQVIKGKFPHVNFGYVTPQYILDWYNLLGESGLQLLGPKDEEIRDAILHTNSPYPQFVALYASWWHPRILRIREQRLILTGYDMRL